MPDPLPKDKDPTEALAAAGFELLGRIGAGSSSIVYRARATRRWRDVRTGQEVAIKVLRSELARDPVAVAQMRREAELGMRVRSPHVARIHGIETPPDGGDGPAWLVMQLVAARTLRDFLADAEPAVEDLARRIGHDTAQGLAALHRIGIVHRDVKPENIFIERDGQIKLLDFGLARSWDGRPVVGVNATENHMVVGTPHYSQPEQLKTRVLTPASDVYSLATILYELLASRSPLFADRPLLQVKEELRADPTSWLKAHVMVDPEPICNLPSCRDLPTGLVRGLARALNKDPDSRPPNAGAFANILGMVLHRDMGIPVAAKIRMLHPDESLDDRIFLPGSYRIGSGERCEIKLRDDSVPSAHAVLEWSGVPNRPHLRPLGEDGLVSVNDRVIESPVELGPEDEFAVGSTRLCVII